MDGSTSRDLDRKVTKEEDIIKGIMCKEGYAIGRFEKYVYSTRWIKLEITFLFFNFQLILLHMYVQNVLAFVSQIIFQWMNDDLFLARFSEIPLFVES